MSLEDRLRGGLHGAAGGSAEPPPWREIRQRAAAWRRRRRAMAYPLTGLLAVLVLVGGVVVVVSVGDGDGDTGRNVTAGPTSAPPEEIVAVTEDGRLVVLASEDGSELRTLAEGADSESPRLGGTVLTVTPDGARVFFDRPSTTGGPPREVVTVPTAGGATQRIVGEAAQPAVSPDGSLLAFVRYSGLPDGSGPQTLTIVTTATVLGTPEVVGAWTVDDAQIAFLSWAPDSRHLTYTLFTRSEGSFPRVVDAYTTASLDEPERIFNPDGSRIQTYLGDTGQFLGTQAPPGTDESRGVGVVTFNAVSGAIERTLFRLREGCCGQTVSADRSGRHVLAIGLDRQTLYRWSEGDAEPTRIAEGILAAAWLPGRTTELPAPEPEIETSDDAAVALTQDGRVVVMNAQTGEEVRTLAETGALGDWASLAVDPIEQDVYFTAELSRGGCGPVPWISKVPVSGGASEPVISGAHPAVSPNGQTMSFLGAPCGTPALATRPVDAPPEVASPVPHVEVFGGSDTAEPLAWSPDSGRFIYRATPADDPDSALYITKANGGVVTEFSGNRPWSAATYRGDRNDNFIVAEAREGGFAVVVIDGSSTQIAELFTADGASPRVLEFDATGRQLLYVAGGSLFLWTEGDPAPTKVADGVLDVDWAG